MFRNSRIPGAGFWQVLPSRVVRLLLLLAFSLESAGRVTSVQAAPDGSDTVEDYHIEVSAPKPVCAGRYEDLRVRVFLATREIVKGKTVFSGSTGVGQAEVIADLPINATVDPSGQPLQTGWFAAAPNRPGEVTFKIRGLKPGKASIVFYVQRPDGKAKTFTESFTVVSCKYKVKILYRRSVQGFSVVGNLSTTIKGDGQQLAGSGIMDAKSTVVAACGVTITDFLGPTDITATSSEDGEQLNLNFKYGSATTTTSVSCPEDTITFSKTQDPTAFLIASAVLPSDGGSRTFAAPQGGTMTITAEPEEEGAGS